MKLLQSLEHLIQLHLLNAIRQSCIFIIVLQILQEVSSLGVSMLLPVWKTATSHLEDVIVRRDNIFLMDETIRKQNNSLNYVQLALGTSPFTSVSFLDIYHVL